MPLLFQSLPLSHRVIQAQSPPLPTLPRGRHSSEVSEPELEATTGPKAAVTEFKFKFKLHIFYKANET